MNYSDGYALWEAYVQGEKIDLSQCSEEAYELFALLAELHNAVVGCKRNLTGYSKDGLEKLCMSVLEKTGKLPRNIIEDITVLKDCGFKRGRPLPQPEYVKMRAKIFGMLYGLMKKGKSLFPPEAQTKETRTKYIGEMFGLKNQETSGLFKALAYGNSDTVTRTTFEYHKNYIETWMAEAMKLYQGPRLSLPMPHMSTAFLWDAHSSLHKINDSTLLLLKIHLGKK